MDSIDNIVEEKAVKNFPYKQSHYIEYRDGRLQRSAYSKGFKEGVEYILKQKNNYTNEHK